MNVRVWYEIFDLPVTDEDLTLTKSKEFIQTDAKHIVSIVSQEYMQVCGKKFVRVLIRHMREL